ncbi:enoyl-CoA hydratase/isomerase family protein [Shouchella shacheensis]|uniref:enoyl-CoA hydratase/isomerase family protein n=1 Tax=Shouchella shacheensis TaxID=1649580 RepID=UPI00074055FE|nr:enoyl-CoA hydratase-related protein [Shouchella shacheensis]
MNEALVTLHVENQIATIALNRPEVKNALNDATHEQLYNAFEEASENNEVRVIVLTGSGDSFCSGADLTSIDPSDMESFNYGRALRETYNRLITRMVSIGKPIIAYVNGIAFGAGLSIALACDYRIAAPHARVGLGFLNIGLVPDAGASYFLPRIVGYPKALELPLKGIITAEEAQELGLITAIGELDLWLDKTKALPRDAFRLMKQNFRESFDHHLAELLEMEVTAQRAASESADHRVALEQFVNKSVR